MTTEFMALVLVVVGWFANDHFNRKHEIKKKQIECRLETLKAYFRFYLNAQKNKSLDGFNEIQVLFLLYGYEDEIALVTKIAETVQNNHEDYADWIGLMTQLNNLLRSRLREQLKLPLLQCGDSVDQIAEIKKSQYSLNDPISKGQK